MTDIVYGTSESSHDAAISTVTCDLVLTMCLKANAVEDLPYAKGMLNKLNPAGLEACRRIGNKVKTTKRYSNCTYDSAFPPNEGNDSSKLF